MSERGILGSEALAKEAVSAVKETAKKLPYLASA